MTTLLLTLLLLAPPPARSDDAALATQDARFATLVAGDVDRLDAILDPSLTYHHSAGVAQTKDELMAAIRSGKLKYKAIEVLERRVRRFGSVVVITGTTRIQVLSNGEAIDTKARFTDVYEDRDGRLRQVAWQNTRIP